MHYWIHLVFHHRIEILLELPMQNFVHYYLVADCMNRMLLPVDHDHEYVYSPVTRNIRIHNAAHLDPRENGIHSVISQPVLGQQDQGLNFRFQQHFSGGYSF